MKKIAILLALLFALAANAYATTVTVSAYQLQNLPFNPTNIGSTRTFTVTATNGVATVTSSAAFPSAIVGIAGFQVSIGGTQYVVASVQSTSLMTLTTNYAGVTGSATMTLYPYVLLRAYATAGFQDNVTGQNVQPGTPGSGNFYKQVAVSIINSGAGNVAWMPEFTIPSTTDALINNQARYVFGFYRTDGSLLSYYLCGSQSQLALQPNTPTTWTAICNFNSPGGVVPPNNEVYTKSQIDQRFPNCSAGQLYYFAANGNILSCLTLGTGLSITGGVLNSSGGGGSPGGNNLSIQYNNGGVFGGYTLGAQLVASSGTLKTSGVRPAINAVVDYGVVCDGSTNTLVSLQNAINAAAASGGGDVVLPAGNCRINGTLSVPGGVSLYGQGKEKTIISSTTNAVILDLVQGSGTYAFIGPKVRDLWVDGSDSGSSQIGINVDDATFMRDVVLTNITISDCGSHGLAIGNTFSSEFRNIYSTSNVGYNFFYLAPNMPANYFYGLYSGDVNAATPAGYRIKQGDFTCWSCNGVNTVPATAYWAIIGGKAGDIDGDVGPFFASARFTDCNIEGAPTAGVLNYPGSVPIFDGNTRFVGLLASSGSWKAVDYDTDASLFPENSRRGYIDDTVVFANSPASYFANSQPIHADGNPPVSVNGRGPQIAGGGFIGTYYNSATSRAEQINRVDGYAPQVAITTTTNFTNPGIRNIRATCGSNCTITLPNPVWYANGNETVTVINRSATGVNVTIAANGGSVNGSSYVLSVQGASAILYPDDVALDWRVIGNRIGAGSTDFYSLFDSANTITQTGSLISNSGSNLLFAGTTLYGADNTIDIGSSSDNRPRNIYGATALTVPRVYYGGGSASTTAGSATPEGAVTAEPGSIYLRTNGTWYQKTTGSGNTGWTLFTGGGGVTSLAGTANQIAASAATGAVTLSLDGPHNFTTATTNGVAYGNGTGALQFTAAGGPGTLCLVSTAGAAPVWAACSGSTATALSSITAASTSNTVSSGDNGSQVWQWSLTTNTTKAFSLTESAASTATSSYLFDVHTLSTSTLKPIIITAGGTANGVEMSTTGSLGAIGSGGIVATTGDTATAFFSAGTIEAARGGTGSDSSGSTGIPRVTAGTWTYNAGIAQLATSTSADLRGVLSDETGSGVAVFATTPTLVTPVLGVATATSINKVAITAPATSATLTIADGKTLTASNTLTLAGTDGTTMTFPSTSGAVATADSTTTFTNKTYNTAGTGNSFSINGQSIATVSGNTSKVGTTGTPSSGKCLEWDANGNIVTAASNAACGGTIAGSGSTGTIAKFTSSGVIGDSLFTESGSTITTAGRQTITGLTISTDATNTVASLTANATFTKNNSNPRDFFGVLIKPTFNFGGSNSATIVNILEVDSVNTSVTGLTTNLLSLKYGGNIAFNVDSDGGITFASGIRQAFAPSTIVASLNVGQVAADPSSPVNGDMVYETNTNKFRCYENSAWVDCISSGANTALSNLASVAINTSLLSDTTLTDDLGSASFYWRRAYAGQYFADATITSPGTTGNQTINKSLFSINFGIGRSSVIVTNSMITTSSLVVCTPQKKDTTLLTVAAEVSSGSVNLIANAGATAETKVACIVYNQ